MRKILGVMLILLIISACSNESINNSEQLSNGESITNTEKTIAKTLTATGFAGSSLNKINLYSNGDVYWVQYDGAGFEDKNIVKNELIAQNAEDIQELPDEEIISISGEYLEIVNDISNGWIEFKKEIKY